MRKFAAILLAAGMMFSTAAVAQAGCGTCDKTIVEVAKASKFETLVKAVSAADLAKVLGGEGPFTVFAPTDKAFSKVDKETLASLLKPENKDKLVAVLKYHVVPGKVMSKDVVKLDEAKTAGGKKVMIKVKGDKVMINKATVTKADIKCKNGVIHVIDTVLIPKA